jgi:P-type Cu2+ transporter
MNVTAQWSETTVRVSGMHCAACAQALQRQLAKLPGVSVRSVSVLTGRVSVRWNPYLTQQVKWFSELSNAGYPVIAVSDDSRQAQARSERRAMLWRWLVAGFCSMQVMMYAWPSYVSSPGEMDAQSGALMNWASAVLTIPVVLFSARPFFASAWRDLRQRQISMDTPVAIGVLLAFLASLWSLGHPNGLLGESLYFDSVTMLIWILLSARWLELHFRHRAMAQIESLREQLPSHARRLMKDGGIETVATESLQIGDTIRVGLGECFAADGILLSSGTTTNESLITGESFAVHKRTGQPVVAGSVNMGQSVDVRVCSIGQATQFGQVLSLIDRGLASKIQLSALADRVAAPLLWGVLLVSGCVLAWWWGESPARAVQAALAVLLVTCPCALAMAAPAAAACSIAKLAKHKVLVTKAIALEVLSRTDHIIFDKTGTLSDSHLIATMEWSDPTWQPDGVRDLCLALTAHSVHPASQAVQRLAAADGQLNASAANLTEILEVPGGGIQAKLISGEISAAATRYLRLGSVQFATPSDAVTDPTSDSIANLILSLDGVALARFSLQERPATGAKGLTDRLLGMGIGASLCSGDTSSAVRKFVQLLGDGFEPVLAACRPEDKLQHLQRMRNGGHIVCMVGDGINDSPVLAAADVSVSLRGASGLAQMHADVVLLSEDLALLPLLIQHARRCMAIVRQNLAWAVAYNILMVPVAALGCLTPWLAALSMAMSSLLVMANALRLLR